MRWYLARTSDDGEVVVVFFMSRAEADEICHDMKTGDDSTSASKLAFRAFMKAADNRLTVEHEESSVHD